MKKTTILNRLLGAILLLILCSSTAMAGDPPDEATSRIKQKLDYIIEKGLLLSQLDPNSLLPTLPVGIVRQIGGKSFIIAIDSARVKQDGGQFSVFAGVKLPNTTDDDYLAFAAKNVGFKANGGINFNNAKLMLVSERIISINDKVKLRLPADGHNYIEWDCNGFKTINLKGEFIFDTSMIKPDLEMNPNATKVTATFEVTAQADFNFLISTSITPFKIARLGDMSFSVTNATVDLSDLSNPNNFYYPVNYPSYYAGDGNLWRGFYLEELVVKLPKGISTANGRAKFTAHNVVIDEMGFSGSMGVSNLFDINSGSLDGWAFSVDSIGVQILQNRLIGGSLSGTMNVPFLKNDTLSYEAEIEQRNGQLDFSFMIQTNANHTYNMAWGGTLKLNAGSSVKVEKSNGKFIASALLHGELTVSQTILNVNQLKFQDLALSTQSPYLISGKFEFANSNQSSTQPRLAKFPISISNLGFGIETGTAYFKADVSLNLMNSEDRGFSAKTSIRVKAKMEQDPPIIIDGEEYKKHRWVYDGITVSTVTLAAKMGSMELNGSLTIFNNTPPYGNGFRGSISVKFPPMKQAASANVYFGSTNEGGEDYRYWQVNLYVPVTIPVGPVIDLKGILGGASYHMTRVGGNTNTNHTFGALSDGSVTPTTAGSNLDDIHQAPEFDYVPAKTVGLGIMLGVTLVVKNEKIINADATLGVEFNTNGGINKIWFSGAAYFFAGMDRTPRNHFTSASSAASGNSAPVVAYVDMLYDNPNNVFHASIKTYIRFGTILRGIGDEGLVGEAVVHMDPRDWYIYVGRPSQMMGLNVLSLAQIRTYFMMGTRIERMPNPPTQVSDILGGNWTAPDYGGPMASGQGFGFGAHFSMNGDFTMGPFYASFGFGVGADIMITKYNGQVNCDGTVMTPGIKGWYAAGQVYAYLQGSIGIKIRKKRFSIIDIGAAAILQARLPNPTFMKGAVGGKFRLLGGLIKGSVRFKFTIGKDCTPVGGSSEVEDIKIIESIKPDSASTYASVFVQPTAVFNMPLDVEIPMVDDNGTPKSYRIVEQSITLTPDGGSAAPGTKDWTSGKDGLAFRPNDELLGATWYTFRVVLKWQIKSGSSWTDLSGETETREIRFRTGNRPMSIPFENVDYSYPISRQYNVYKNQSSYGYVQLKTGQPSVFATNDEFGQWTVKARFYPGNGGAMKEVDASYNTYSKTVSYTIPQDLDNAKVYTLVIVKVPVGTPIGMPLQDSAIAGDENVYVSENTSILQDMNQGFAMDNQAEQDQLNQANTTAYDPVDTTEIAYRVANLVNLANEVAIYRINFRTSKFNTINDKFNALSGGQDVLNVLSGNITAIGKRYATTESFDEMELFGKGNKDIPLLQTTSSGNNDWYQYKMYPQMYELYGTEPGLTIDWRNINDLAEPNESSTVSPFKAVKAHNNLYPTGYALTDDQVLNEYAPSRDDDVMFAYYLSYYCSRDFNELRNKAATMWLSIGQPTTFPVAVERLLFEYAYTDLTSGTYGIKVNYQLPGSYPQFVKEEQLYLGGQGNAFMILNDEFNSGVSDWVIGSETPGTYNVTNDNGRLKAFNNTVGDSYVKKQLWTENGKTYKLTLDLDKGDYSSLKVVVSNYQGIVVANKTVTASGQVELIFTTNDTLMDIKVERVSNGTTFYLDNVRIVKQ